MKITYINDSTPFQDLEVGKTFIESKTNGLYMKTTSVRNPGPFNPPEFNAIKLDNGALCYRRPDDICFEVDTEIKLKLTKGLEE